VDVVISGSSGLIGSRLGPALARAGHRPIRLVRRKPKPGADEIEWLPDGGHIDAASLEGVDAVVHLAGAGIGDKRWNDSYKRLLVTSRTEPTALLAKTLASLSKPPSVLLSGSAIGYYGDRDDEVLSESSESGSGFLPELVRQWEAATEPAAAAGIRTTHLRTGIVLSATGGALGKMLPLFRFGLGGRFASGRQYMSWITVDDEVAAIEFLLGSDVAGPVNLTSPNPVTNATFTDTLGSVLGRPTVLPVPAFGPKLVLGADMAQALLFDSQRVHPDALTEAGYGFHHAELVDGLRAVLAEDG